MFEFLNEKYSFSELFSGKKSAAFAKGGVVSDFEKQIKSKYGITLDLWDSRNGNLVLSKIVIPKEKRGEGTGTMAMSDIIQYADKLGKRVVLTPSTDFGGTSIERLKDFYKRFGFVENKGKHKDFSISYSMYREPNNPDIRYEDGGVIYYGIDIIEKNKEFPANSGTSDDGSSFIKDDDKFVLKEINPRQVLSYPSCTRESYADLSMYEDLITIDELIGKIKKGIELNPIIVDSNYQLIDGNHRLVAYNKLKTHKIKAYVKVNPDIRYENGGELEFKKKKGNEKEHPHTEVYLRGEYLGYYMPNASMASAVDENWNFDSKHTDYPNLRARTERELISMLGKTNKELTKEGHGELYGGTTVIYEKGGIPERYKNLGFTRVGQKKKSTRPEKKWMVLAKKGDQYKVVHGGYKGMEDYTQHHDKERRKRFWNRMGGFNSSKAKDPFSPLYWHKRFGTWEEGGMTPYEQLISVEPSVLSIMDELNKQGNQALIVGGAVRDALLGIEPKDIDVEVYKISYSDLMDFLAKFGKVDLVGKKFGVIKFHPRGSEMSYDFSVPRKENKIGIGHTDFQISFDINMTIEDAALRRDFTINSLAYDPLTNKIYDYFGGLQDLKDRIIRHTSSAFREDALRILRAMQFQARFDFTIHPDTILEIQEMLKTNEFNELSKERVYDEWLKWAGKGIRHDLIFKFMRDTTLINYYPELKLLKETPQDKIYHPEGDVEIHTEMTLREMDKILFREKISGEEKAILVMSILLHDIAKPQTTKEEMKRERMTITSTGHEAMGGEMSKAFLTRIGFQESFYLPVANLVSNHLAGVSISMIPSRSGKMKAVKKLSRRLHPATIRQLLYVMDADNYGRATERKEATGKDILLELSAEADVQTKAYQPILMGRHLIAEGLKPSPQFREILQKSFEAQESGAFNDIEGARMWLKEYLANN